VLSPGVEVLVGLSAALAGGEPAAVRDWLERAERDADSGAVEEALLQAHLFVGFPAVLNAWVLWREMHAGPPAVVEGAVAGRAERGEAVCRTVYGSAYERLRGTVEALHPDLDRWMVEEGYGRVLGRPGLDLAVRELCIVASLVPQRATRQLHSHLRGALHAGASADDIRAALDVAVAEAERGRPSDSDDVRDRALATWARVLNRHRDRSGVDPSVLEAR
jgi:4-carboxymuconolactone decarboxylase